MEREGRQASCRSRPTSPASSSPMPAQATADPYAGFEARIVPENITLLPKTTNETTGGNAFNERVIAVKKGDTRRHHLARSGRHAGRDRRDRQGARTARPRRRHQGRPEAAHADGAGARRPASAADPRHRRQRRLDRSGGGAVRYRQIRFGRRQATSAPKWPTIPRTTATKTTRPA